MADFTPIRVSELPEVTNVGENDYLVVDDGTQTSKIKSKNYNESSSGSAKEYADEAARSASLSTERAEAAAQSVIQVDALAHNASESANNALDYSRDAEAWAKGTRDGSAVPITDATHENNAKYFAQQAQNSATSAAESADAAEELLVSAIDPTLTQAGKAADAKKTGDELANLSSAIEAIEPGLSDDAKTALLNCFQHVAWIDEHGQTYYDALESTLYADSYPRITAVFDAGANVIYTDDALDTLKQYLTVKYFATKESTGTVIASSDYTLSGILVEGTSTVTVSYNEVRTSVSIPGVVDFYNIWEWSVSNGLLLVTDSGYFSDGDKKLLRLENYPKRALAYAGKGKEPYYLSTDKTTPVSGMYPIPVPKDATSITVVTGSNDVWAAGNLVVLNGSEYSDVYATDSLGYGGGTHAIPSRENQYLNLVFGQRNSAKFNNSNLPTGAVITFS